MGKNGEKEKISIHTFKKIIALHHEDKKIFYEVESRMKSDFRI